jgi:hypothetical protein
MQPDNDTTERLLHKLAKHGTTNLSVVDLAPSREEFLF